jgi:hypothetical protein
MDIFDAVYFLFFIAHSIYISSLVCRAKRKQALLESNLPGLHLITDENVKAKGLL